MNEQPNPPPRNALAWVAGIAGTFLIVAGLVWAMRHYTRPAPLGEDRAAIRAKALAELQAENTAVLHTVGWVDPAKGVVRLPIEEAMNLVEREWRNPAAGRSNLIARVEKATAAPPKAPEKPSEFE